MAAAIKILPSQSSACTTWRLLRRAANICGLLLVANFVLVSATTAEEGTSDPLEMNGQGTRRVYRRILFRNVPFGVYSAQLYASEKSNDADFIIESLSRMELRIRFLRSVSASQLRQSAAASFRLITPNADQYEAYRAKREQFLAYFAGGGCRAGDAVVLKFFPDKVDVIVNSQERGTVHGAEFQQMVRRVWLGQRLSDRGLRELKPQLLGINNAGRPTEATVVNLP